MSIRYCAIARLTPASRLGRIWKALFPVLAPLLFSAATTGWAFVPDSKWLVRCTPKIEGGNSCVIAQSVHAPADQKVWLDLLFAPRAETELALRAIIPPGSGSLGDGLALSLDGIQIALVPIRPCGAAACVAEYPLHHSVWSKLTAGRKLSLTYELNSIAHSFEVKTAGLQEALNELHMRQNSSYWRYTVPDAPKLISEQVGRKAGKRYALVIGNENYSTPELSGAVFPSLRHAATDAQLMSATLASKGFDVDTIIDADAAKFKEGFASFLNKVERGAETVLVYYAGHGVQDDQKNYLLAIDDGSRKSRVDVSWLVEALSTKGVRSTFVILDACRSSQMCAVAPVPPPKDVLIAYSTRSGQSQSAQTGIQHSLYASALSQSIVSQGTVAEEVFRLTRKAVYTLTKQQQWPFELSSLTSLVAPGAQR